MQKEAKEKIKLLIDKYLNAKQAGQLGKYNEEETKKDFILPLFESFGWNVTDKREVTAEESQSNGRVDYGFYLNNRIKFYLEAKSLKVDLQNEEYAKQAIRYSWNKGVDWAVLTDFESLKIFYCQDPTQSLFSKQLFEIPFNEYIDRFDQLWLLSKESFEANTIDIYAENVGKKLQKISVGEQLYKHLNECRKMLIEKLGIWNGIKDQKLLDEGVQKLLDRLIFIRVAEDRGVEPPTLIPLLRTWESNKNGKSLYESMIDKFRELNNIYNSSLFTEHPFEKWNESPGVTEEVIETFRGKASYYEYDFKVMPADVLGAVYENYLGHRLAQSQKGVTLDKNAKKRKEQGIYYTPEFIVDYIVRNALQPVLDQCKSVSDLKKIKVLDPACGSGSFLIKALEIIKDKYHDFGSKIEDDELTKIIILQENIYGVDLDEQAVEITRLNLLLNTLQQRMTLPNLSKNIKNGNSLISGSDKELEKYFGKNFRDKKPFNWEEKFPEVFKQGGFDVIIGNPPYLKELDNKELFQEIRKSDFGKYYQGKMDFWYFFLHRSIEILKDNGIMGFITNSYFLKSAGATKLIDHLQDKMVLIKAVDFQDISVFVDVNGRHLIHIWKKTKNKNNATTKYIKIDKNSFNGIIDESKCTELLYSEVTKNSSINFETNIQINEDTLLLGDLYDVSVGVQESTDKVSQKILEKIGSKEFKVDDGVFVLSKQEVDKLDLNQGEKSIIKKYLDTNDIQKYYINFSNEYLIYSNKEAKSKITNGEYLHIKSHLDRMQQFITSSNTPYGLHRPRENRYFENPKLICKGMFLSPEFCFDDEKYYVGFSFSVIIQKDKDYDLKYLLGLLNSDFGMKWFNRNGKKRGVGVDIGVAVFRKFPIYKATKEQQQIVIDLVNKMLDFNKELHKIPEHSDKWESLKNEIEKTDKKIDEEVYKLYGLTPEEIAIMNELD